MSLNQFSSRYGFRYLRPEIKKKKRVYSPEQVEKRRAYSRKYRLEHPEYFKKYEERHKFKLKIQRSIWRRKNEKYPDYWTREQRREYLRNWRAKKKEDLNWHTNYLESLIRR